MRHANKVIIIIIIIIIIGPHVPLKSETLRKSRKSETLRDRGDVIFSSSYSTAHIPWSKTRTGEMALLSLLLLFLAANSALSSRIVGFITLGGSQYINIKHTLEELASRGHEVGY